MKTTYHNFKHDDLYGMKISLNHWWATKWKVWNQIFRMNRENQRSFKKYKNSLANTLHYLWLNNISDLSCIHTFSWLYNHRTKKNIFHQYNPVFRIFTFFASFRNVFNSPQSSAVDRSLSFILLFVGNGLAKELVFHTLRMHML